MRFQTTNIRIEADTLKELKLRAVYEGKKVAEIIREAIHGYLGSVKERGKAKRRKDSFLQVIGMCKSGIHNNSERVDDLLYGKKAK